MAKDKTPKSYQLKVTLKRTKPPIWRRLVVPGEITLGQLHYVLQIAMGWSDCHLHAFRIKTATPTVDRDAALRALFYGGGDPIHVTSALRGERQFGDLDSGVDDVEDESKFQLNQLLKRPKSKMLYEYDFGDDWEHEILVEKIEPVDPTVPPVRCLAGKRACPPEDCGGPWGYAQLLESLATTGVDQNGEEIGDLDPKAFDIAAVNRALSS